MTKAEKRPTWSIASRESLHEIALRHGTDKVVPRRSLAATYDAALAPRRDEAVSLLEIGVFEGASLMMWRDYFPEGRIYGLDRNPEAKRYEEARISIFLGDQEDRLTLDTIIEQTGGLDLIIDDGGHRARQQIGTLVYLWPHLRANGVYIVEDTHTSYLPAYDMAWRSPGSTVEFLKGVVDDVHAMWHDRFVSLAGVRSIHFYDETCLLKKAD